MCSSIATPGRESSSKNLDGTTCITAPQDLNEPTLENGDAPFPAGREAVRMFLRGSFPCDFFLAIGADRPGQYSSPLRNLWAVYRRFCQEHGLARAFCANSALYAKPADALSSKVFSEVVDLASGEVVKLVRTLPCHGRGRGFESRRPRHSFEWFTENPQKQSGSDSGPISMVKEFLRGLRT